jgi:negative regulator of replication initiation
MALSNAERQRKFKQRRREAEEDALRRQWKREDKAASAATKASTKVTAAQQAIRKGVDPTEAYSKFRDREGNVRDVRDLLLTDEWDIPLEDERQRAAEADGTWPEVTVTDSQ